MLLTGMWLSISRCHYQQLGQNRGTCTDSTWTSKFRKRMFRRLCYEGELLMTLITGMMGSDGWVVAADRRAVQSIQTREEGGVIGAATFRSETSKTVWNPDVNLLFAFAGDHVSRLTGEFIVKELRKGSRGRTQRTTFLVETTQAAWRFHQENASGFQVPELRHLLLVFAQPPVEMWVVNVQAKAGADQISDNALIGDLHNGAKLFPLLYYSKRKAADLKLLAAHTILMAHQCAESVVDGMDMWTGDNNGNVHKLPADDLATLRAQSRSIDADLCSLFGVSRSSFARLSQPAH
jgi:hypothetical protein